MWQETIELRYMKKKLNEVKKGDTLYCVAYNLDEPGSVSVIPLTVKEVVTDGPDVSRHIYSKEAIVIKEKVPNSPEAEGEFVIDQYYRGDQCYTSKYGISTTYEEAYIDAIDAIDRRTKFIEDEIKKLHQNKAVLMKSVVSLNKQKLKIKK